MIIDAHILNDHASLQSMIEAWEMPCWRSRERAGRTASASMCRVI